MRALGSLLLICSRFPGKCISEHAMDMAKQTKRFNSSASLFSATANMTCLKARQVGTKKVTLSVLSPAPGIQKYPASVEPFSPLFSFSPIFSWTYPVFLKMPPRGAEPLMVFTRCNLKESNLVHENL